LYTAKGQPSYMYKFPKFSADLIDASFDATAHPMFIMDGVERDHRYIGVYPGVIRNGELLSLPGVDPAASVNFDNFLATARANGPGWGLMTNTDWAGISGWCLANGFLPRGNNYYGRDHAQIIEVGTRQDGLLPGTASGIARTLTGSGPVSWRHDNTAAGIADLNGNVWEWAPGLRIVDGEIHVIADNNAALTAADLTAGSSAWRAIDGATGNLVAPGAANAVKIAASGTDNYTLVRNSSGTFEGMTNPGTTPVSEAALNTLKLYGAYPLDADLGGDGIWFTETDERVALRGGNWDHGSLSGVFALRLDSLRAGAGTGIGARPAFAL
jgi:hypothetical protein